MRIGFVSACHAFDVHLMHEVHARWPLRMLIRVEWPGRSRPLWGKLRRPLKAVKTRAERFQRERRENAVALAVSRALFGEAVPPPPPIEPVSVPNTEINSASTVQLMKAVDLDVLLVSAAPLLRPELFSLPRFGTMNVHRGFAPPYRGEDTLFWAMYYGDYERVAVTVHRIDDGVDTGPILGYGFPRLEPTYDEAMVASEAAKVSAAVLIEILERLEREPRAGVRQTDNGRMFRSRDRTAWASLVGQWRRWRKPLPSRAARTESCVTEEGAVV